MPAAIVLPTYNEHETLPVLLRRLGAVASRHHLRCEAIVVDDSSPDGTAEAAARAGVELGGVLPVTVVSRPAKSGLASAVVDGIARSGGDVIVIMDSDLSHPPELIPRLLEAVAQGADVAVGSRYTAGGGIDRWPVRRRVLSLGATWLARLLLGISVRDPMSGFFAIRRDAVEGLRVEGRGYKILLEILARRPGLRVREVPYRFRDRAGGRSKLDAAEILTGVRLLARLWRIRRSGGADGS